MFAFRPRGDDEPLSDYLDARSADLAASRATWGDEPLGYGRGGGKDLGIDWKPVRTQFYAGSDVTCHERLDPEPRSQAVRYCLALASYDVATTGFEMGDLARLGIAGWYWQAFRQLYDDLRRGSYYGPARDFAKAMSLL